MGELAATLDALAARGVTSLPDLAFVLGSGLGPLADEAENAVSIPYAEIPGFPQPSVAGHKGRLVVGELEGRRVALFQGRGHFYERGDPGAMAVLIETFKTLGGRDAVSHQCGRRPAYGMDAAGAGRDHRSHQLRRRQSADRAGERRPLRAADARLRSRAAGDSARRGATRRA